MTISRIEVEKSGSLKASLTVAVKPYIDESKSNMGLERYSMTLFEGAVHEEPLMCLESNGVKRYVTGLNEFAPEIKMMKDEDERKAKIKEIREHVARLEADLASNVLDIKDKDFWSKVLLLKPDNSEFWNTITLRCGNEPIFLDEKDPFDFIKLRAIEAGGFSIIAKSLAEARKRQVTPKFYLDKNEETASVRTEVKKLRNKALAELQKLYDTNVNKLFYVCKIVDVNSTQYRKSTPNDILYDNMDSYINGLSVDKDKRKTASRFLEIIELDAETLKLRSLVKDGSFLKIVAPRGDGHIYHMKSGSVLGKNPADVVEYLRNPLNEDILTDITSTVEKFWNS